MANSASHAALPYPIKGARFTIQVPYLDADGDPTDPTTPDTEISEDGGSFTDCAEEVTTITGSNGCGYITVTGAETDNSMFALAFKVASGPKATIGTFYPRVLASVGTGTLSAGSAGGGTLGTLLAYDVTGCFIKTTGGTGGGGTGGANNQVRKIVTYNTGTGAFTVTPNWETTPSTDTTYDVLLPEGVTLGMLKTLNPTTAGRTLDVSTGGEAGIDWANVGSPTTTLNLSGTTVKTATDVETDTADIQSRLPAALVNSRMDCTIDGTGMETGAVDAILNRDASASTTNSTLGAIINDWENGGRLDLIIDDILVDTGTTIPALFPANFSTVTIGSNKISANVDGVTAGVIARAAFAADTGLVTIRSNTAQAGAGTTVTLDASASATDDFYNGLMVLITGGTGAGQVRQISDYVGSTKVATIRPAWATNPDNTSTFALLPDAWSTSVLAAGVTHGGASTAILLEDLTVTGEFAMDTMVVASGLSANITGNITGTLSTVTTLTNLPAITANWLTAAGTASDFGTEVATAVWALATRTLTAATNISGPIADQVWEEALGDHSATAGSTAEALAAAGGAGDPWITPLPGSYTSGQAGKIVGDYLNATISSRASQTSVDDLPTNGELTTALGTADDAVLAAIAALNNLSSAQVTAAVWHADVNANDNTVGSFGDYFGQMYTETTVSTPTTLGTLATQASVNTIDDFLDTEIAAIKAKTDNLPAAPAAVGDIPTAIQNADALLNRSITNTQDTADVHSLTTVVLAMLESSMSGTTWTIRKTGGTTFTTKTLTVDAAADPITGVT